MNTRDQPPKAGGRSSLAVEQTFGSATPTYKWAKIKTPPAGHATARAKRGRWWGLATWPRRRPLTIRVAWRGGPESWWWVEARGRSGCFAGSLSLDDVMAQIANEWDGPDLAGERPKRPKRTSPA